MQVPLRPSSPCTDVSPRMNNGHINWKDFEPLLLDEAKPNLR